MSNTEKIKNLKFPNPTEIKLEISNLESEINSEISNCLSVYKNIQDEFDYLNAQFDNCQNTDETIFHVKKFEELISNLDKCKNSMLMWLQKKESIKSYYNDLLYHVQCINNLSTYKENLQLYKNHKNNNPHINENYSNLLKNNFSKLVDNDESHISGYCRRIDETKSSIKKSLDSIISKKKLEKSDFVEGQFPELISLQDALEEICITHSPNKEYQREDLFLFLLQLLFSGELKFKLFKPNFLNTSYNIDTADSSNYSEFHSFINEYNMLSEKKIAITGLRLDCFSPHIFPYTTDGALKSEEDFYDINVYKCLQKGVYPNWICKFHKDKPRTNQKKSVYKEAYYFRELPSISNHLKDTQGALRHKLSKLCMDDVHNYFECDSFLSLLFSSVQRMEYKSHGIFTQHFNEKKDIFSNGIIKPTDGKTQVQVINSSNPNPFSKEYQDLLLIKNDIGEKQILWFLNTDKKALLINKDVFAYDSRFSGYYEYLNSIIPEDASKKSYPELFLLFLKSNGINIYGIEDKRKKNCINIPIGSIIIQNQVDKAQQIIDLFCDKRASHFLSEGTNCFLKSLYFDREKFMSFILSPEMKEDIKKYVVLAKPTFLTGSKKNLEKEDYSMTLCDEIRQIVLHLIESKLTPEKMKYCQVALALRYNTFSMMADLDIMRFFYPEEFEKKTTSKKQADLSNEYKKKIITYLNKNVFKRDMN